MEMLTHTKSSRTCFLFAAKLRKRNEKALGKGRKVGAEGESLNKCSEFWAILIIERSGLADSVSSSYLYWIVQIE